MAQLISIAQIIQPVQPQEHWLLMVVLVLLSTNVGGDIIANNTGFSGVPDLVGFGSVTAATFFGDGAGLSNTGAQMSEPTTGTQRLVLTNIFSGTMIAGATDSGLTYNFGNDTLTAVKFSGDLTGDVTGTASKATDVVGAANRVLFNSSTDDTTTSANLTFDGTTLAPKQVVIANTDKIFFGSTSSGLNISYTNATNQGSKIVHNGTDDLRFQIAANQMIFEKTSGNNFILLDHTSGEVRLGHAASGGGNTKLTTKSDGVDITGKLRASDDIIAFSSSDRNLR